MNLNFLSYMKLIQQAAFVLNEFEFNIFRIGGVFGIFYRKLSFLKLIRNTCGIKNFYEFSFDVHLLCDLLLKFLQSCSIFLKFQTISEKNIKFKFGLFFFL